MTDNKLVNTKHITVLDFDANLKRFKNDLVVGDWCNNSLLVDFEGLMEVDAGKTTTPSIRPPIVEPASPMVQNVVVEPVGTLNHGEDLQEESTPRYNLCERVPSIKPQKYSYESVSSNLPLNYSKEIHIKLNQIKSQDLWEEVNFEPD